MLAKFEILVANSCSKCGTRLSPGDTVFAENADEVLAGKAVCKACSKSKKVVEVDAEEEVEEEPKPSTKKVTPYVPKTTEAEA